MNHFVGDFERSAIRSPARSESELFWVILGIFWPIQAATVAGEPLCCLETLFW